MYIVSAVTKKMLCFQTQKRKHAFLFYNTWPYSMQAVIPRAKGPIHHGNSYYAIDRNNFSGERICDSKRPVPENIFSWAQTLEFISGISGLNYLLQFIEERMNWSF